MINFNIDFRLNANDNGGDEWASSARKLHYKLAAVFIKADLYVSRMYRTFFIYNLNL